MLYRRVLLQGFIKLKVKVKIQKYFKGLNKLKVKIQNSKTFNDLRLRTAVNEFKIQKFRFKIFQRFKK